MFNRKCFLRIVIVSVLLSCGMAFDFSYAEGLNHEADMLNKTQNAIDKAAKYIASQVKQPTLGAVSGEWAVLGLSRSGNTSSEQSRKTYSESVINQLKKNNGVLSVNKYSEYSRVILAHTVLGFDVTDVGGYNLLHRLADYNQVIKQGINGPIYALIALDSVGYDIPNIGGNQTTRQNLLDYIVSRELSGGGFALSGTVPDPDISGMALSALSGYTDKQEISEVVERTLLALSSVQLNSSESISQVIIGLASIGVDPEKDFRYAKVGSGEKAHGLVSELLTYQTNNGGFRHVKDGEVDLMSTEQALLALEAARRLKEGEPKLFDMSDEKGPGALYRYKVKVYDRYLVFDQPPINKDQRILVPMRTIFEGLGAAISWDQNLMQVTGMKEDRKIVLTIGEKIAYINEKPIALDVPGMILNGRTMVPVRFIAESLDADVSWDGFENTVLIKY